MFKGIYLASFAEDEKQTRRTGLEDLTKIFPLSEFTDCTFRSFPRVCLCICTRAYKRKIVKIGHNLNVHELVKYELLLRHIG